MVEDELKQAMREFISEQKVTNQRLLMLVTRLLNSLQTPGDKAAGGVIRDAPVPSGQIPEPVTKEFGD